MISGTALAASAGLAFSLANSPGLSCMKMTPPLIELRVVSLPPTISSIRLPRNSSGLSTMSLVPGLWASSDRKSNFGGCAARSAQSFMK